MKDLTVKQKNIDYAFKHGYECLVKIATKELLRALPKNIAIPIVDGPIVMGVQIGGVFIKAEGEGEMKLFILGQQNNMLSWENIGDEDKMQIYNKLFLKFR